MKVTTQGNTGGVMVGFATKWLFIRSRAITVMLSLVVSAMLASGCPSKTIPEPDGAGKTTTGRSVIPAPGHRVGSVGSIKQKPTPAELVDRSVELPEVVDFEGGFVKLSYSQAVLYSEKTKKPMMFYIFTPWCGPCKQLDAKVFPDKKFIDYMTRNIIAIKIDAATDEERPIAESMGINSYPTMIVCEPGGKPIEKFFAFHPTDEFIQIVSDYIQNKGTASWYKEEAMKNADDLVLQMKAGKELAIRKRGDEAIPFLMRVLETDKDAQSVRVPEAMFLLGKSIYLDQMRDAERAFPLLDELAKRFPTTYYGSEALYSMAMFFVMNKQLDKASDIMLNRISTPDHDAVSFYRFATFCQQHGVLLDEATERVKRGLELHPSARYLLKALADLHFKKREYDEAVKIMTQLVSEEPSNESYKKTLGNYKRVQEHMEKK